jgi:hypothetical protein
MRLIITDEIKEELSFDTIMMTSLEFNDIHNHPYIASSNFDVILIDLRCKINLAYLRPLMKTTKVVPFIVGDITSNGVSILSELCKDRSAELRIYYMRDKSMFNKLIEDMKSEYCWNEFY